VIFDTNLVDMLLAGREGRGVVACGTTSRSTLGVIHVFPLHWITSTNH